MSMPLLNPSFEDVSIPGTEVDRGKHEVVPAWFNWVAGKSSEGVSIRVRHSDDLSPYVQQMAQDGNTYLELALHKNDTWQSIGQESYNFV